MKSKKLKKILIYSTIGSIITSGICSSALYFVNRPKISNSFIPKIPENNPTEDWVIHNWINDENLKKIKEYYNDWFLKINDSNLEKISFFIKTYSSKSLDIIQSFNEANNKLFIDLVSSFEFNNLLSFNPVIVKNKLDILICEYISSFGYELSNNIHFNYYFTQAIFDKNIKFDAYKKMNEDFINLYNKSLISKEITNDLNYLNKNNKPFNQLMNITKSLNGYNIGKQQFDSFVKINSVNKLSSQERRYKLNQIQIFKKHFPNIKYVNNIRNIDRSKFNKKNNLNKDIIITFLKNLFTNNHTKISNILNNNTDTQIQKIYYFVCFTIKEILLERKKLFDLDGIEFLEKVKEVINYIPNETFKKILIKFIDSKINSFKNNPNITDKIISEKIDYLINYIYKEIKNNWTNFFVNLLTDFFEKQNINFSKIIFIIDILNEAFYKNGVLRNEIVNLLNLYPEDMILNIFNNFNEFISYIKNIVDTFSDGFDFYHDIKTTLLSLKEIFRITFKINVIPDPDTTLTIFYYFRFSDLYKQINIIINKIDLIAKKWMNSIDYNNFENLKNDLLNNKLIYIKKIGFWLECNIIHFVKNLPYFDSLWYTIITCFNGQNCMLDTLFVVLMTRFSIPWLVLIGSLFDPMFDLIHFCIKNNVSFGEWIESHFKYCGEDVWGKINSGSWFVDGLVGSIGWLIIKMDVLNLYHSCIKVLIQKDYGWANDKI